MRAEQGEDVQSTSELEITDGMSALLIGKLVNQSRRVVLGDSGAG